MIILLQFSPLWVKLQFRTVLGKNMINKHLIKRYLNGKMEQRIRNHYKVKAETIACYIKLRNHACYHIGSSVFINLAFELIWSEKNAKLMKSLSLLKWEIISYNIGN